MLVNHLTQEELAAFLTPILRLEPADEVLRHIGDVLRIKATYRGFCLDVLRLETERTHVCIEVSFSAKAKWWHEYCHDSLWLPDQNAKLVSDLKRICMAEINDLKFVQRERPFYRSGFSDRKMMYHYDRQAYRALGCDRPESTPLFITTLLYLGKCWVQLLFDGNYYNRSGGRTQVCIASGHRAGPPR